MTARRPIGVNIARRPRSGRRCRAFDGSVERQRAIKATHVARSMIPRPGCLVGPADQLPGVGCSKPRSGCSLEDHLHRSGLTLPRAGFEDE